MLERSRIVKYWHNFFVDNASTCLYSTGMENLEQAKSNDGRVRSGRARMGKLTPQERRALAQAAAKKRWAQSKGEAEEQDTGIHEAEEHINVSSAGIQQAEERAITPEALPIQPKLPTARYPGQIDLGGERVDCYVLDNDVRVISLRAAVKAIAGVEGGILGDYVKIQALRGFINSNLVAEESIDFNIAGVPHPAKGITAEQFIEICNAYVHAMRAESLTTERQKEIAIKCSIVLGACAKLGLIALIDEATGYQRDRPDDALQVKIRLFIAEEMRKWERTFPDQLWEQFGRLTNWKGTLQHRPKYWGKLVMELIYEYLDADVAQWLRENAPSPRHRQNYHQWLNEQYGLKKLIEHIWKVVGVASTCQNMPELKQKMEEIYGKAKPFQFSLQLKSTQP